MHVELPQQLPLICPACRRLSERGRELWTLSLDGVFAAVDDGQEVIEGRLRCDNPDCGRGYPILDGIPLLVPDPAGLLAAQPAALTLPLRPETLALLTVGATDDAPLNRLLEHLSIYLDAHFGDQAQPPPDGPRGDRWWGGEALFTAVAERAVRPVDCAIELGCSVGRGVAALAAGAGLVVGLDLHLGALRLARRIARGEGLDYLRRVVGRSYAPARIPPLAPPPGRRHFICGDALDPPLAPHQFGRVVALNLLDSVRQPGQLLSVVDGLCRDGGELLLASPYSWQSGVVEEAERPGGADPAGWLRGQLTAGRGLEASYAIEAEVELPWYLRRDARSSHSYTVHTVRARKAGEPPPGRP